MQRDGAAHANLDVVWVRAEDEEVGRQHSGNATLSTVEVDVACPSCGEPIALWIDVHGGSRQRYVEDCAVCCRPMQVVVAVAEEQEPDVHVTTLDA